MCPVWLSPLAKPSNEESKYLLYHMHTVVSASVCLCAYVVRLCVCDCMSVDSVLLILAAGWE